MRISKMHRLAPYGHFARLNRTVIWTFNLYLNVNPVLTWFSLFFVAFNESAPVSLLRNGTDSNSSLNLRSLRSDFSGLGKGSVSWQLLTLLLKYGSQALSVIALASFEIFTCHHFGTNLPVMSRSK